MFGGNSGLQASSKNCKTRVNRSDRRLAAEVSAAAGPSVAGSALKRRRGAHRQDHASGAVEANAATARTGEPGPNGLHSWVCWRRARCAVAFALPRHAAARRGSGERPGPTIVVEGATTSIAVDHPLLFHRDRSGARQSWRRGPEGDRHVLQRQRPARRRPDHRHRGRARQIINRVAFEGNSKIKSDQLAVEVQSKPHTAFNEAVGRRRHRPHQGGLQEVRAQRGQGHQTAGPVAQRPRRSGLHHRRRRQDRHPRDQVRRQPRRFELPSGQA